VLELKGEEFESQLLEASFVVVPFGFAHPSQHAPVDL
jgi:hypothetical protein